VRWCQLDEQKRRFNPIPIWLAVLVSTGIQIASVYKLRQYSIVATDTLILLVGAFEVTLIGAYFMHLKFEQKSLLAVALIPIFIVGAMVFGILASVVR